MKNSELKKYLDEFIQLHIFNEYSENTIKQYKYCISVFFDFIGDKENISKLDMIEYKRFLEKNYPSTRSINKNIVVINKYLKWVCKDDKSSLDVKGVSCDLCIKKIKMHNKASNEEILTIKEYKRLLSVSKKMGLDQLYLIMKILAQTGIRISELEFFTVENIKKNKNYIRVYNKGKEREIIVKDELSREIRRYIRANKIKAGYIFRGEIEGKMPVHSTLWRQMKKVAAKASIKKKKIHAHSFRHLFAQIYLSSGGDVGTLMQLLGHNSINTTMIYTQLSADQKRAFLNSIKL